jgi:MFS family permease
MRKAYQVIVLIKNFATGVMAPVLTLALMARGASIGEVSLMMGTYSFTVIAMEFPSGVYADLYGRKKAFLLSAALYALCYGLFLTASSAGALFCAMAACGLGRAFSSGSIEALVLDEAVAGRGADSDVSPRALETAGAAAPVPSGPMATGAADAAALVPSGPMDTGAAGERVASAEAGGALVRVTARLSILESAGLAAGSLAGGLMAGLAPGYRVNLAVNLTLYALLFLMALFFVREAPRPRGTGALKPVRTQVRESLRFMARPGEVRMLFALSMITGFALIGLETYWQPALSRLSPAPWALGAVSFAGFCSVILGSHLAQRLIPRFKDGGVKLLLALKALVGICLALLAFQTHALLFALVYMLAYLMLGGGGVAESARLNRATPASQRASILSLFSFVMQAGGLIASLCGYLVTARVDFTALWCVSGALLALGALAFLGTKADR